MDFILLKSAIAEQFEVMQKHDLFRTGASKDVMWNTYLKSFPPGSNPTYKERTEHDCQCCKQFIRAVGNVVAVIEGKVVSIWDVQVGDPNYQAVVDALSALVKASPIIDVFLHNEKTAGTDKNFQQLMDGVKTWTHFFVNIKSSLIRDGEDIGPELSSKRADHDVLYRSLKEITDDAIDIVLDLIAQNSLYRGDENKNLVERFKKLKEKFNLSTNDRSRDALVWSSLSGTHQAVARIRNTAIGTLLVSLSEGKDIEDAVKVFETVVAPTNYRRPTTLVTKGMVEKAQKKIEELGLTSALERRYATLQDITINNILFADRKAKKSLTGDVFDQIAYGLTDSVKNYDKVDEVSIEKFVADILPKTDSIEVLFDNRHVGNLVSLIAPTDPTAGRLFKWDNNFSWAYNGEVADSIKERVKKAGGNVTGDLCCRLAWFNYDDLDLHMIEPDGTHIYYKDKRPHRTKGQLDIDMNAGHGTTRSAVENIFYAHRKDLKEGLYRLDVNNFSKRETIDFGFDAEIDFMGTVYKFPYNKALHGTITVAEFTYSHKDGLKILKSIPISELSREAWGMKTRTFQRVSVLMLSPNYWNGQYGVGNKHYFFILDNCLNTEKARGFFNEFLKPELETHRKVFELVGAKMRTPESNNQLSGLGFSTTQRNSILCRIKGSFSRTIKLIF